MINLAGIHNALSTFGSLSSQAKISRRGLFKLFALTTTAGLASCNDSGREEQEKILKNRESVGLDNIPKASENLTKEDVIKALESYYQGHPSQELLDSLFKLIRENDSEGLKKLYEKNVEAVEQINSDLLEGDFFKNQRDTLAQWCKIPRDFVADVSLDKDNTKSGSAIKANGNIVANVLKRSDIEAKKQASSKNKYFPHKHTIEANTKSSYFNSIDFNKFYKHSIDVVKKYGHEYDLRLEGQSCGNDIFLLHKKDSDKNDKDNYKVICFKKDSDEMLEAPIDPNKESFHYDFGIVNGKAASALIVKFKNILGQDDYKGDSITISIPMGMPEALGQKSNPFQNIRIQDSQSRWNFHIVKENH